MNSIIEIIKMTVSLILCSVLTALGLYTMFKNTQAPDKEDPQESFKNMLVDTAFVVKIAFILTVIFIIITII